MPLPIGPESPIVKETGPGDFVAVKITSSNSQVLKGIPVNHSSIKDFYQMTGSQPDEENFQNDMYSI